MIKTFRGQLADAEQRTIRLGTNQGLIGYKISKFDIISNDPLDTAAKGVVMIYKNKQASVSNEVNFDNSELMAVCYYTSNNTTGSNTVNESVVFDTEVVNQDLFITNDSGGATQLMNYYIEMEQVILDLNEATVATLKDMRGRE